MSSLPPAPPPSLSPSPSPSLSSKPPRRVPPPCWTHDETLALIESYHEKWYALRRGNLKASHWQEVADAVARRCRFATPSKTSVQCRHKIEKLRKRYRTEKQRAAINAPNRFSSSWNFFKKMDDMEKGPLSSSSPAVDSDAEDDNDDADGDDDDDEDDDADAFINSTHHLNSSANYHRMITNGSAGAAGAAGAVGGPVGGFRFRIPSGSRSIPVPSPSPSPLGAPRSVKPKNYPKFDESPNFVKPNPNARYMNSCSAAPRSNSGRSDGIGGGSRSGSGSGSGSGSKRERDPVADMVSSIRMLGEGFVKMEHMKIETAKEMEQMRMEMEMKRTEMILESQQKIVEAFAKGISANKKIKRIPSPES